MAKILTWRYIDSPPADASTNMAIDEALLRVFDPETSHPILRLYSWQPAAVSMGVFQNATDVLNTSFLHKNRIPFVRRPTGGGLIYHDEELTYCLIIPKSSLSHCRGIQASYKYISSFLIAAYKALGLQASFAIDQNTAGHSGHTQESFCFAGREKYDILVNGKKIGGNAQRRTEDVILQHGSIPIRLDLERSLSCLRGSAIKPAKVHATALKNELRDTPTLQQLKETLRESCALSFNSTCDVSRLSEEELKISKMLKKDKYEKDDWNVERRYHDPQPLKGLIFGRMNISPDSN